MLFPLLLTIWWSQRAGIPSFDHNTPGCPGHSISSWLHLHKDSQTWWPFLRPPLSQCWRYPGGENKEKNCCELLRHTSLFTNTKHKVIIDSSKLQQTFPMKDNQHTGYAVLIITGLFSHLHILYPEISLHPQAQRGPNIWGPDSAGPIKGNVLLPQIPIKILLCPITRDQHVSECWNCNSFTYCTSILYDYDVYLMSASWTKQTISLLQLSDLTMLGLQSHHKVRTGEYVEHLNVIHLNLC